MKNSFTESQFLKRFLFAMAIFLLLIAVQTFAIELLDLSYWQVIIITLIPVLPLVWAFFIYRAKFKTLDEYVQRLTGEAFLWVLGILCFGSFIYGMLSMKLDMPEFNIALIMPIAFGGHGLILQLLLMDSNREK